MGVAGHPILETPTMDRLAAEGVRFTSAFVTTSICAASRATILTGLYERTHRFTFDPASVDRGGFASPLARELTDRSYPALLRDAGYRTGFVGKIGMQFEPGAIRNDVRRLRAARPQPVFSGREAHLSDRRRQGDRVLARARRRSTVQPFNQLQRAARRGTATKTTTSLGRASWTASTTTSPCRLHGCPTPRSTRASQTS